MRKHKLFLPALFTFILIFGTSIFLGVFCFGGRDATEAYRTDNASPIPPPSSLVQAESEPEPQPEPEQSTHGLVEEEEEQITALREKAEEVSPKNEVEKPPKVEAKIPTEEKQAEKPKQPAPKNPVPPVESKDMVTVATDSLNVRPTPSTSQQPIDALSRGQKVEVLGKENNWRR